MLAQKWGSYLNKSDAQESYYQPIANLLNIIPNTFSIPWNKCVITEGPSDRHVLIPMYRILNENEIDFTIYPGNSAHNLGTLISLNIGWNSKFKVLLDSDKEGRLAADKYKERYGIDAEILFLPDSNNKIEKCFSTKEKEEIKELVMNESGENVTKKEFATMWALICEDSSFDDELSKILSPNTKSIFNEIFKQLL